LQDDRPERGNASFEPNSPVRPWIISKGAAPTGAPYPYPYPMGQPYPMFINQAMMRMPMPKGTPKKLYFQLGALGSLIMFVGALILGYVSLDEFIYFEIYDRDLTFFYILGLIFLETGMIMLAIGFFGYYYNYGSQLGAATTIAYISAGVILAIYIYRSFSHFEASEGNYTDIHYSLEMWTLSIVSYVLFGISLVMSSATIVWWRHPAGNPPLAITACVFGCITAGFFISIVMLIFGIGFWVLAATSIMFLVVFYKNQLPEFDQRTGLYRGASQSSGTHPFMPSPMMAPPFQPQQPVPAPYQPQHPTPMPGAFQSQPPTLMPEAWQPQQSIPTPSPASGAQKLICPGCDRKFAVSTDATTITCPYCGESGVVE